MRIHLVRHGAHAEYGTVLSGRTGSASLSEAGRAQAARAAAWMARERPAAIHASPRHRTQETAAIIAATLGIAVDTADALDEIDFGAWNGRSFAALTDDPDWDAWNALRATAPTPGGETMAQAVTRAVDHIGNIGDGRPGDTFLCVTHCDIIRGVIAHYLGLSLDNLLRFDIEPGSVSTIVVGPWGGRVVRVNEVPA